MKFVIDGYNLLHASPIMQRESGQKWLEKQRFRLLRELAGLLPPADRTATVVVFDASKSPSGVPSEYDFEGIAVRFARDHAEADDLIEELIAAHATANSLTVVSSDTRLQRAAKRRKAGFIDSREWFDQLKEAGRTEVRETSAPNPEQVKDEIVNADDVQFWLAKMRSPSDKK
ncbi:MAG: NYN domain-containing protein [Pirellulaceae bacterium]|nr:NYN domain-containing protein [Pirellulaceae bacterium]